MAPSASDSSVDALLAGVPGGKGAILAASTAGAVWFFRETIFFTLEKALGWLQVRR